MYIKKKGTIIIVDIELMHVNVSQQQDYRIPESKQYRKILPEESRSTSFAKLSSLSYPETSKINEKKKLISKLESMRFLYVENSIRS